MSKNKFIAYENVFDQCTLRGLFKLSSQGYFEEIKSPVKIGKESNVFTVDHDDELRIVKVYRTAASFAKMMDYMRPDPRYSHVKGSKLTLVYTWAKKEFANLLKARKGGVIVPTPYAVHKNILCMEMIGDSKPAPMLHKQPPKDVGLFYKRLRREIKLLYKAKLVHTDISEYNILNYNDKPILIDFSHAVDLRYPGVEKLLMRDINNLVRYFAKFGLELDADAEFKKIVKS
tara:strand:- start:2521 stop:3213 length:693 start_codon:yes stop_codon:yes gene_type:complete